MWDRIRDLKQRGVTMILTTHDMDEAASLCARVAIMDHGKILAMDTPDALTETVPGKNSLEVGIALGGGSREALLGALTALPGVERAEPVSKGAVRRARWLQSVGSVRRRRCCSHRGAADGHDRSA